MDSTRSLNTVVVWVVDVLVAGLFLAVGVPKILGLETNFFQFAAMRGFPDWIRIVVGVCEVIGAISLLIPRLSAYAALGLAMLMVPAAITQQMSGQPGVYVPIVLFVVLLILAERRNPAAVRAMYRSIADTPHPLLKSGTIAGVIGATCVAGWFFIVDIVSNIPFATPLVLGHALLTLLAAHAELGELARARDPRLHAVPLRRVCWGRHRRRRRRRLGPHRAVRAPRLRHPVRGCVEVGFYGFVAVF